MERIRSKHSLDPWLITGSSFYWTAVVLSFMFIDTSASPAASPSSTMSSYLIIALFIALIPLCKKLFVKGTPRRIVAIAMMISYIFYTLYEILSFTNPVVSILVQVLYLASVACQMVFWGFAYASLEKTRACQNVCCSMLLATLFVLLVITISGVVDLLYVPQAFNIAAVIVLASGKIFFANRTTHSPTPLRRRALTGFAVSRIAFGLVIGFCLQLPGRIAVGDGQWYYAIIAIVLVFSVLMCYLNMKEQLLQTAMPALPLICIAMLVLPYLNGDIASIVGLSAGIIWLAWVILSAAQLSELKETCGMSELLICVIEKAVLCLSIVAGAAIFNLIEYLWQPDASSEVLSIVVITISAALILIVIYIMASLVSARKEDEYLTRLELDTREKSEELYRALGGEFSLSEREIEVMILLDEGYTRKYIQDALSISEGTVKAHVAHIYQKLNIHRKDDLLDLIESRRRQEKR